jgi:hypothetical protein
MERPASAQVPAVVDLEILFLGLRRSGNHSVINWLLDHADSSHVFYNNVWPQNPFLRSPDSHRGDGTNGHVNLSVCSFEDRPLCLIGSSQCYPYRSLPGAPAVKRRMYVVLMRDPFNLFASQLKSSMDRPRYASGLSMAQLYLSYISEHVGSTNVLDGEKLFILYNRWRSDKSYRESIAGRLGLTISERALDKVPKYGGGSSFEGRWADGNGSQMRTHERWMHYKDDSRYVALFRNRLILEYGLSHFDLEDDLVSYVKSHLASQCTKGTEIRDYLATSLFQPLVIGARGVFVVQRLHQKITGRPSVASRSESP